MPQFQNVKPLRDSLIGLVVALIFFKKRLYSSSFDSFVIPS